MRPPNKRKKRSGCRLKIQLRFEGAPSLQETQTHHRRSAINNDEPYRLGLLESPKKVRDARSDTVGRFDQTKSDWSSSPLAPFVLRAAVFWLAARARRVDGQQMNLRVLNARGVAGALDTHVGVDRRVFGFCPPF